MKRDKLEKIMTLLKVKTKIEKLQYSSLRKQQQDHMKRSASLILNAKTMGQCVGSAPSPGELASLSSFVADQLHRSHQEASLARKIEPQTQEARSRVSASLQREISLEEKLKTARSIESQRNANSEEAKREEIHSAIKSHKTRGR